MSAHWSKQCKDAAGGKSSGAQPSPVALQASSLSEVLSHQCHQISLQRFLPSLADLVKDTPHLNCWVSPGPLKL